MNAHSKRERAQRWASGFLLVALWVVTASILARVEAQEAIPPFAPCAKDKTYRYFEKIQYDAYVAEPTFLAMLRRMQDTQGYLESVREVGEMLDSRSVAPSDPRPDSSPDAVVDLVRRELENKRMPTCYESPAIYWMLNGYAQRIDQARRKLELRLRQKPKVGSLPTTDINAYTYPAASGRGSVIAFNTQLLMFAYQMTKVTLPTIQIQTVGDAVRVDRAPETALLAIAESPELRVNFTMALLEFLGLTSPTTQPIAPKYDPLVITFTEGMELFAVAHEYAHVIANHTSPTIKMRLGATDTGDGSPMATVFQRSWAQEFEADRLGITLVAEALKKSASQDEGDTLRWIYALKGSLFFFKALDLIDRARHLRDLGAYRIDPTIHERVLLRDVTDHASIPGDLIAKYSEDTHPPAWLRLERASAQVDQIVEQEDPNSDARQFAPIADGLLANIDILWGGVEDRLQIAIRVATAARQPGADFDAIERDALAQRSTADTAATSAQFLPGCTLEHDFWLATFFCEPALQRAVDLYQQASRSDDEIIGAYGEALRADPLLLSGAQIRWASSVLNSSSEGDEISHAIAIVALSGSRGAAGTLNGLRNNSKYLPQAERAASFLDAHGRDTSWRQLRQLGNYDELELGLLSYPSGVSTDEVRKLAKLPVSVEARRFLTTVSAVDPSESLSSMAFALLAGAAPGKEFATWADLALNMDEPNVAVSIAQHGLREYPNSAELHNTMGNALSALNRFVEANVQYEASLRAGRNDGWPEANLAMNFAKLNELAAAESWFRKALAKRESARSPSEYARYLNEFAWFLVTRLRVSDKFAEALAMSIESNTLTEGRNPNYLDTLAECFAALGDFVAASQVAEEALALVDEKSSEFPKYKDRLNDFTTKAREEPKRTEQ